MPTQARASHDPFGAAQSVGTPLAPSWPAPPLHATFDDDNPFARRRRGSASKLWLALLLLVCVAAGFAWLHEPSEPTRAIGAAPPPNATKPSAIAPAKPVIAPADPATSTPQALRSANNPQAPREGSALVAPTPTKPRARANQAAAKQKLSAASTKPAANPKLTAGAKAAATPKLTASPNAPASSKPATKTKPTRSAPSSAATAKPTSKTMRDEPRDLPVRSVPSSAQQRTNSQPTQFAPRRAATQPIRTNPYE